MREIETDVVGNKNVKMAITVVVEEGATSSPAGGLSQKTGGFGYVGEGSIAIIAIKLVLTKVRAKQILKSIVVIVADTNSTSPSDIVKAGFLSNISENTVAIVS